MFFFLVKSCLKIKSGNNTVMHEKGCRKKSTKVHATRPKGSMGRSIELLHVLNATEI